MNYRTAEKIFLAAFLLAGACLGGASYFDQTLLIGAAFVLLLGGFAVYTTWHRCPRCHHFLGRNVGTYCPHCGRKIK